MARMPHVWHIHYMIFKYEKGTLYFTRDLASNTLEGIGSPPAPLPLPRTICEPPLASDQESLCKLEDTKNITFRNHRNFKTKQLSLYKQLKKNPRRLNLCMATECQSSDHTFLQQPFQTRSP